MIDRLCVSKCSVTAFVGRKPPQGAGSPHRNGSGASFKGHARAQGPMDRPLARTARDGRVRH